MISAADKKTKIKAKQSKKARKKVSPRHRFMPHGTNPRWLQGFSGDWADLHSELLNLMTESSDDAMAYKRNLFAHLNAARYAAIRACMRATMRKTSSKLDAVHEMERMLQDIEEA